MEYTKNYHLPQWVREDRILMEDFNQAMANIENGLTGVDQNTVNGSAAAWNGILQSAWNLMAARYELAERSEILSFQGLTVNPLTSEEMTDSRSTALWLEDAGILIGQSPEMPGTLLRESCTGYANALSSFAPSHSAHHTATYGFTAPMTGNIIRFRLFTQIAVPEGEIYSGLLDFKTEEKDGSSWKTVYEKKGVPLEKEGFDLNFVNWDVDVRAPVTAGREYRLSLTLTAGQDITGSFGFIQGGVGGEYADSSVIVMQRNLYTSGSHSRTLSTGGGATRALVMAFYQADQNGGTISAAMDGRSMRKVGDEPTRDQTGRSCRRACFLAEGNYGETAALRLSLSCQEANSLHLLSYAVMFL